MRTKTLLQAEKMLDAAAELFGTQRFHEVRMEDIATLAGVGKGTLYRYFNDKEELYMALLERAAQQIQNRLQLAIFSEGGARAKLRSVVASIISFFDGQPHLLNLIQRAEVLRGPDFPWKKTRQEMLKLVTSLLKEAIADGETVAGEPELVALMLLAGLRGVLRFGKKPRPKDLAQRIVDLFLSSAGATYRNPLANNSSFFQETSSV